jgi:hypothetical protein
VLGDFISKQEQFTPILQQHMDWVEQLTAADSQDEAPAVPAVHSRQQPASTQQQEQQSQQQQQQQQQKRQLVLHMLPVPDIALGALPPRPLVSARPGYMLRLLSSVTPQDLQQVMQMTVEGMRQWHMQVFYSLTSLLEFASQAELRHAASDRASQAAACSTGQARHCAAGSCGEPLAIEQQLLQQAKLAGVDRDSRGAAAAASSQLQSVPEVAAAAAAAGGCESDSAEAAVEAATMQRLEGCVDNYLLLTILMFFHSTMVPYTLAGTNVATGAPAMAPPHHWLQVKAQHMA